MIVELVDYGFPGYWIDSSQIIAVLPVQKIEDPSIDEMVNRLEFVLGGQILSLLTRDTEEGKYTIDSLHEFMVEELKKRDA